MSGFNGSVLSAFRKYKALLAYHIVCAEKRCNKRNCIICGVNDCPFDNPTHYSKEGCESCQLNVYGTQRR